jgi:hypothetical protein
MFWGALLILAGLMLLLQNYLGIRFGTIFWSLLFGVGGMVFLSIFFGKRDHWWALIPGFTLLSLSLVMLINFLAPGLNNFFSGSIVLGGIGVGFLGVYLADRNNWWAIIPAGVMFTLMIVAVLDDVLSGFGIGGIFFLGLGLTFGIVALIPSPEGRMNWAWIPAAILIAMGVIITATAEDLLIIIGPAALIILGFYLIYRTTMSRN